MFGHELGQEGDDGLPLLDRRETRTGRSSISISVPAGKDPGGGLGHWVERTEAGDGEVKVKKTPLLPIKRL